DGVLDDQTAEWFTTSCEGVVPLLESLSESMGAMASADDDDVDQVQDRIVDLMDDAGDALSETAEQLADIPPPNIEGGEQIAPQVVAMLAMIGPQLHSGATEVGEASVSTIAELETVVDDATGQFEQMLGSFSLDELASDEDFSEAILELPACAPLAELQQQLGDMAELPGADDAGDSSQ